MDFIITQNVLLDDKKYIQRNAKMPLRINTQTVNG